MKDLAAKAGLLEDMEIASAATSSEEIWNGKGNPVYPPARRKLLEHGIDPGDKRARQMNRKDYDHYDLLIGMDDMNLRNMKRICGGDPQGKIHRMLEFAGRQGSVADPWYTGDFAAAWDDIYQGCCGLIKQIKERRQL